MRGLHILWQRDYKPGDQAPEGYLAWHEWAEVQHKAGLRQQQCGRCGLWRYPQQLSATVDRAELTGMRNRKPTRATVETPVCNECELLRATSRLTIEESCPQGLACAMG